MSLSLDDFFVIRQRDEQRAPALPRPGVTPAPTAAPPAPPAPPLSLDDFFRPPGSRPPRVDTGTVQRMIVDTALNEGVPPEMALAVASAESNFRQEARSRAGAVGVMQLMPETARALGVDPTDLRGNILGGVRKLRQLYAKYHSWPLALAAYNAGEGAVDRHKGVPPYPETRTYIQRVLSAVRHYGGEFLRGLESGATMGYVRAPAPRTPRERIAREAGAFIGQAAPLTAISMLPGVSALAPALRAGVALGGLEAGEAAVQAGRGEAPAAEIPRRAAGGFVLGITGEAVLRMLGPVVRAIARRLGIGVRDAADRLAAEARRRVDAGEPAESAVRNAARQLVPPRGRMEGPIVTPPPTPEAEMSASPALRRRIAALARRGGVPARELASLVVDRARAEGRSVGDVVAEVERTAGTVPETPPAGPEALPAPRPGERPFVTPAPTPRAEYEGSERLQERVAALARRSGIPGDELAGRFMSIAERQGASLGQVVAEAERTVGIAPETAPGSPSEALPPGGEPTAPEEPVLGQMPLSGLQPGAEEGPPTPRATSERMPLTPPAGAPAADEFERIEQQPVPQFPEQLDRRLVLARRWGLTQDIERMAREGRTDQEIARAIQPRVIPQAGYTADEIVRTVRERLGIPEGPGAATPPPPTPEAGAAPGPEVPAAPEAAPESGAAPRRTPALGPASLGMGAEEVSRFLATAPDDARRAVLERARGALDAVGGNVAAAVDKWGTTQSIRISPRKSVSIRREGIAPVLERIAAERAQARAQSAAPHPSDPVELARAASSQMAQVIARAIEEMTGLARSEAERAQRLAETRIVERDTLGRRAGAARRSKELLAREHEARARDALGAAADAEARIESLRASGLTLPPLPDVPAPSLFRAALARGDQDAVDAMRRAVEQAARQAGDATRAIVDASGGWLPEQLVDESTPAAARRYVDELTRLTRTLGEYDRLLGDRVPGVPPSMLDEIKRTLGIGQIGLLAPGTDLLLDAVRPVGKAWEWLRTLPLWRELVIPMQSIIRKAPSGEAAIDRMDASELEYHRALGAVSDLFQRTLRLSREERWNLRAVREARAAPLTARVDELAREWDRYFARVAQAAERHGFLIYDPRLARQIERLRELRREGQTLSASELQAIANGPYRPWQPRQHYWPILYRARTLRDPRRLEAVRRRLYERALARGLDEASARTVADAQMDGLLQQQERGRRYGHLEMARTAELPDEFREEPEVELSHYILQAEKAVALANQFGRHVPVPYGDRFTLEWEGARALMTAMRREGHPDSADLFDRAFQIYSGAGGLDALDREFLGGVAGINRINVMANMSWSAVWKLTQPFTNAPVRTSLRAFIGGLFDILAHPREGFRFAQESGALIDDVIQAVARHAESTSALDRWSRQALTLYGFVPAVTWSRAVAAATGRRYARSLFDRLLRNSRDQFARRELAEMLGDGRLEAALARGALTPEDYLDAGFRIARDVEFLGRADRYPAFWATPFGQFLTLYHRFTAQQATFILRRIVGELRRGNLSPLLVALPTWFVVGDAAQTLSEQLRGRQRPSMLAELYDWAVLGHPPSEPARIMAARMAESLAGWSVLGLFADVAKNMLASQARAYELITGPSAGEALQIGYHGLQAVKDQYEVRMGLRPPSRQTGLAAFERDIVRHVPFVGARLATRFRTPHERYVLLRDQALAARDAGDLATFFDLQGQLTDMGRGITYSELVAHDRNKLRQEIALEEGVPPQRPAPGEPDYVPARR